MGIAPEETQTIHALQFRSRLDTPLTASCHLCLSTEGAGKAAVGTFFSSPQPLPISCSASGCCLGPWIWVLLKSGMKFLEQAFSSSQRTELLGKREEKHIGLVADCPRPGSSGNSLPKLDFPCFVELIGPHILRVEAYLQCPGSVTL